MKKESRSQGYVSLNEIIDRALLQMGETGTHKKLVALTHAQDCWRKLIYDVMRQVKTECFTLDAAKTLNYPEGYVKYTIIGMCTTSGLIRGYGKSPRMCPLVTDNCGNEVAHPGGDPRGVVDDPDADDFRGDTLYYWHFNRNRHGQSVGKKFGYGGGYNMEGYFTDEKENRRFVFSSDVDDVVVLQYICDGVACSGNTMVHVFAEDTIRNYIKWNMCEGQNSKLNIATRYKNMYDASYRTLRLRSLAGTLAELTQAFRRPFKQTPKS